MPATVIAHVDDRVNALIDRACGYLPESAHSAARKEIWRAYEMAREAHSGQFRKSGEPYVSHPVEAAHLLITLRPDITALQACLLHDVPEDTVKTIDDIRASFGDQVAYIVEGITKLGKLKYRGEERTIWSLRKMLLAMSEDLRVIFVKLADRAHNMLTLWHHPDEAKRKRIALETLNIYAPIADRLGIFNFKELLETECFRHLYPEEFASITSQMDSLSEERELFVAHVNSMIRNFVPPHIPIVEVSSRVKSPWSIYKKMLRKNYDSVRDIYDLFAVRLVTDTTAHCYEILGVVHTEWAPVPKRFKDYIALPKSNSYQSLHTTVVGMFRRRTQPTEIQIRTGAMHRHAEIGIAAHFEYSETGYATTARDIEWVAELKKIVAEAQDEGFYEHLKMQIFEDRIFAFTPKGDIKTLPKWATPVDFAYSIHSDLGNQIGFAKINGKGVPLDSEIRNGDTVEIITASDRRPSVSWLSFVKTSRAKDVIKNYLNAQERDALISKGRDILNNYLEKQFGFMLDKDLTLLAALDGRSLDMNDREDILVQIGNKSRRPSSLGKGIISLGHTVREKEIDVPKTKRATKKKPDPTEQQGKLLIDNEADIPHTIALCCHPKLGDRVVGYITRSGVKVHRVSCASLKKANLSKLLPCRWSGTEIQPLRFTGRIEFSRWEHALKTFVESIYHLRLTVEHIEQQSSENGHVRIVFTIIARDEDYYVFDRLVDRLRASCDDFVDSELVDMK